MSFGSVENQIQVLLDSISFSEHLGPRCPSKAWEEMSIKDKEVYFVYLRSALERVKKDPVISEEAIEYLLSMYLEKFKELVNVDSKLRKAVTSGIHTYFMAENTEFVEQCKALVLDDI